MSSKERSLLAGAKDFSELRQVEFIEFSVARVDVSCNLKSISLEVDAIRYSSKEEVLTLSSRSLSFE